jgi:hypothetical protein
MNTERMVAKPLAPEDIRRGMYVMRLQEICEILGFWLDDIDKTSITRVARTPWRSQMPLRVAEVCLPFLLVEDAKGRCGTLDVRQVKLAQVSDRFGREAVLRARAKRERAEAGENASEEAASKA